MFLWRNWGIWSTHIGWILGGMLFIIHGITSILGVTDKKVIRGMRFGLEGVAMAFMVVGLVLIIRTENFILGEKN